MPIFPFLKTVHFLVLDQAVTIFNGLRLEKGSKNENDQETPVPRLAWKQFGAVLNQMENLISDLIWDVFFTRGNLVPELGLLRDILLLNRADLFSNFYDLVREHLMHEASKLRCVNFILLINMMLTFD